MTNRKKGILMMVFATFFWGLMSITSRYLSLDKISPQNVSFLRCFTAAILLSLLLLKTNKSAFKITPKQLLFCMFFGLISYSIGLTFYSMSIERIPIAVATVLMFSNPIWVSILNYVFFKESISLKRIILITTCILGCLLVIDIFSTGGQNLDMLGVLFGVLNGLTFGLQIILPKFVEGRIQKDSLLMYGFWSASISLLFFIDLPSLFTNIITTKNSSFTIANVLSVGILSTFIANSFYVKSTEYIGTSLPSMMVALEPIFASFLAWLAFNETIKPIQVLGAIIVILSVLAMDYNFKNIKKFIKN